MPNGTRTKRTSRRDHRESVWSVNERWRQLYFTLFLLLMGAGSSFTLWREAFERAADKPVLQSLVDIFAGEAAASVASAGIALWITEVVMLSTMIGRKLDERKARILREVRREGRDATDAAWRAWYERMQAARSRGAEFAEPPPSLRSSEPNGASRKNGA